MLTLPAGVCCSWTPSLLTSLHDLTENDPGSDLSVTERCFLLHLPDCKATIYPMPFLTSAEGWHRMML